MPLPFIYGQSLVNLDSIWSPALPQPDLVIICWITQPHRVVLPTFGQLYTLHLAHGLYQAILKSIKEKKFSMESTDTTKLDVN